MTRARPPAYIELTLDDDELRADIDAAAVESWLDEKTVRFDFDKPNLTAEDSTRHRLPDDGGEHSLRPLVGRGAAERGQRAQTLKSINAEDR